MKKKNVVILVVLVCVVSIFAGVILSELVRDIRRHQAYDASTSVTITKEEAKAIALERAELKETDVRFVKVELDRERGTAVYEVEFNHGLKEYNAEIKAEDGTILKWEEEFED